MVGKVIPEFEFKEPQELARRLIADQIQRAIMPGIEYGWHALVARRLAPIAVEYAGDISVNEVALTNAAHKASDLSDVRGEKLAIRRGALRHARVFMHQ